MVSTPAVRPGGSVGSVRRPTTIGAVGVSGEVGGSAGTTSGAAPDGAANSSAAGTAAGVPLRATGGAPAAPTPAPPTPPRPPRGPPRGGGRPAGRGGRAGPRAGAGPRPRLRPRSVRRERLDDGGPGRGGDALRQRRAVERPRSERGGERLGRGTRARIAAERGAHLGLVVADVGKGSPRLTARSGFGQIALVEEPAPERALRDDDAPGVHVLGGRRLDGAHRLGRGVSRLARDPGAAHPGARGGAEIDEARFAGVVDEDVRGRHVRVHPAGGVERRERTREIHRDRARRGGRERPAAGEEHVERRAPHVLDGEVGKAGDLARRLERDQGRRADGGEHLGLACDALRRGARGPLAERGPLEHVGAPAAIAEAHRQEHLGARALGDAPDEEEVAEDLGERGEHDRGSLAVRRARRSTRRSEIPRRGHGPRRACARRRRGARTAAGLDAQRPHGRWSVGMTGFRDPPSAESEARSHRVGMARVLVGAPDLPQPLPRFGLDLLDVEPAGRALELVLGAGRTPVARARIEPTAADAGLDVAVRETHPLAVRHRAAIQVIRDRLGRAITDEKWRAARKHADAIAGLPVGVPLSHFRQLIEGIEPLAGLVRTGFGCNQDCGFCWQSRDWPGYGAAQVRTWIEDLYELGARDLTISGGEPTLDRALFDHIRRAREIGMRSVVIETNAIMMGKRPAMAAQLRDAGLTRAFVSLHSGDAAVSDAATRAPGTHARTVAGIRALLDAKVHVILNAVVTRDTVARLPELPGFLRRTFGKSGWLGGVSVSVPVLPFEYALTRAIIAEPEDVRASLARTIDAAEQHGVLIFGIDGPCGPPLCAFGADRRVTDLSPKAPVSFRTHVAECEECRVRRSCHGVQSDEYELFGPRAIAPIR